MELDQILKMTDRQEAYMELARKYFDGSNEDRELIAGDFPFSVKWIYPDQKRLACQKGEIWSCKERVEASVVYYGIAAKIVREEWELDPRDVLMGIGFNYNACIVAELNPDEIFQKVAKLAPPYIGNILSNFTARIPEDKNFKAFGISLLRNNDGEMEIDQN